MPLSQYDPARYFALLEDKQAYIESLLKPFVLPPIEVFPSPPQHFRMRAEFRIWQEGDYCYYAMFHPEDRKTPIRIDSFPIGSQLINRLMPALLEYVNNDTELRRRLFQAEFLTTQSGEALVTLIYHRSLSEPWMQSAQRLAEMLNIKLIGRSKKQKLVLSDDFVTETLTVDGKQYRYRQVENGFTQPNAAVNEKMLYWVQSRVCGSEGDALELYCGNGNFTIVLAANFQRVLATEIAKTSVASAHWNFTHNGVDNVAIARMSSAELTQAMNEERVFRRLADIDLNAYHFSTVLVDPPRAGLDNATEQFVSRFDNILYISCNPMTLAGNLQNLKKTHDITHFAIFDQFPYTHHIECGVYLRRRRG